MEILNSFESWHWIAIGLLLIGMELIIPGVFLLWVGLAALSVSIISAIIPMSDQSQIIIFSIFVPLFSVIGKKFFKFIQKPQEESFLNKRAKRMVGEIYILDKNLTGGHSRMKIGDSYWKIIGEDMPAGQRVEIISVSGNTLHVKKA